MASVVSRNFIVCVGHNMKLFFAVTQSQYMLLCLHVIPHLIPYLTAVIALKSRNWIVILQYQDCLWAYLQWKPSHKSMLQFNLFFFLIDQPTLASLLMFCPTVKSVPTAPFIAEWWAALKLTGGEGRTTQGWTAVRHAVLHIKSLDNDLTHSGNIC